MIVNDTCNEIPRPPIKIAFKGRDDFKDIERALIECDPIGKRL